LPLSFFQKWEIDRMCARIKLFGDGVNVLTTSLTALALIGAPIAFANEPPPESPLSLDAVLTVDALNNVSGGLKTGGRGMANLDLSAAYSGDNGWEAFGYVLVDAHGGFSEIYPGDAQVVSNIDAPAGTRLFEAWVRKTSLDQKYVGTFGLINLNGIFDTQPVAGVFLGASHGIGPDFSQAGPSIFPLSGLGLVGEWRVTDATRLRAGVFDAMPGDPEHQSVFVHVKLSKAEGAHVVAELEHNFKSGFVKLGHWQGTARADRLDGLGQAHPYGSYAQAGMDLITEDDSEDQGLKGWVRAGFANADVLDLDRYLGGGLVYTGLIPGRDADQLGLAIAHAHFGKPYQVALGVDSPAESTIELTYQAEIKPGLILQPDIQHIRHPGGDSTLKDAVVVGLRLRVGLEALR
jgi:porin